MSKSKNVTFAKDFDYRTRPDSAASSIVAYKAGWSGRVPGAHASAAEEAGALEGAATEAAEGADDAPENVGA